MRLFFFFSPAPVWLCCFNRRIALWTVKRNQHWRNSLYCHRSWCTWRSKSSSHLISHSSSCLHHSGLSLPLELCFILLLWCLSLRQDLKETFIDSGVMSAIKEWISPLPDKSLPALRIREELLRILQEVGAAGHRWTFGLVCSVLTVCLLQLPSVSQETLKHSGIGRAVMFLYKHPKESRSNKDLALKLISKALTSPHFILLVYWWLYGFISSTGLSLSHCVSLSCSPLPTCTQTHCTTFSFWLWSTITKIFDDAPETTRTSFAHVVSVCVKLSH